MSDWWKSAVFYHIYPRSFYDSNGDGIGDLAGIAQKIDYLKWLGIDAIWVSPFYVSPMKDFGYDVADYTAVDPIFGDLADFDLLLARTHEAGLKLVIDFVPNHTSDQHPWFIASRADKTNPHRDWYIWGDPADDGGPPNNWLSRFNGRSAWKFDQLTGQYYLHSFLESQPDVNWRNPGLAEAMDNVLRFWLSRGVDGFRVDVSYRALKDPQLRDNPPDPNWREGMDPSLRFIEKYNKNYSDIHILNKRLRSVLDEFPGRVLIGEMYLPFDQLVKHYGQDDEFHLPFNFSLIGCQWNAATIAALIQTYEAAICENQWPNWVLGNHDKSRIAARAGKKQVRNAMLLLLTLRGTPTIYYGDELGMTDGEIPPHLIQDPCEKNMPGLGLGRDPVRTPMQWSSDEHAGFSSVPPWLPIQADYRTTNVESEAQLDESDLMFTRRLLTLRRQSEDLVWGGISNINTSNGLLSFRRGKNTWVFINLSDEAESADLPLDLPDNLEFFGTDGQQVKVSDRRFIVKENSSVIVYSAPCSSSTVR